MSILIRWLLALMGAIAALVAMSLAAHELQPGFLELREISPGRYDVLWKLPSLGSSDVRIPIVPVFPERCRQLGEARSDRAGNAWIFTARLDCQGGLAGQTIAIEGLEAFTTDVLVRVQHAAAVAVLALVAGLVHGYVNGATLAPGGASGLGLAGAVTAVFCVLAILSTQVTTLQAAWTRIAMRVAGSWIAASGLLMLG